MLLCAYPGRFQDRHLLSLCWEGCRARCLVHSLLGEGHQEDVTAS